MRGGLAGEHLELYTADGSSKVKWQAAGAPTTAAATWLKTIFTAPSAVSDGPGESQLLLHATGLTRRNSGSTDMKMVGTLLSRPK